MMRAFLTGRQLLPAIVFGGLCLASHAVPFAATVDEDGVGTRIAHPPQLVALKESAKGAKPPGPPTSFDPPSHMPAALPAFLTAVSAEYTCKGKKVAVKWDAKVIDKFADADDQHLRALVKLTQTQLRLQEQRAQQEREVQQKMQQGANRLRGSIMARALGGFLGGDDGFDIAGAAEDVEDAARDTQLEINKLLILECQLTETKNAFFREVRKCANKDAAASPETQEKIQAKLVESGKRRGQLNITNQTERELHHCLIMTKAVMQKARMAARGGRDAAVGRVLLPEIGFSRDVDGIANQSARASELRAKLFSYDQGTMVYIPEIPAGGVVQLALCDEPGMINVVQTANISLWSDELAIESQSIENLAKVQQAVQAEKKNAATKNKAAAAKGTKSKQKSTKSAAKDKRSGAKSSKSPVKSN